MTVFDVDFDVLVQQLMPVRLRQLTNVAWLKCLEGPVKWLYNLFKVNRDDNLYMLAHNSQICYIEDALNDTFDPVNRRIYIADPPFIDPLYIYEGTEQKPVFIDLVSEIGTSVIPPPDPPPLYLNAELYTGGGSSFIVNVPVSLGITVTSGPFKRLKALVDLYRLPGRVYNVVFF